MKYFRIFMVFVLLFGSIQPVFANGADTVTVSSPTGLPGSEVSVSIALSEGSACAGGSLAIAYDAEKLEVLSANKGSVLEGVATNINTTYAPDAIKTNWMHSEPLGGGELCVITFRIKQDASGTANVAITDGKFSDLFANELFVEIQNGGVIISSKVDPIVVWPSATGIPYGMTFGDVISGGGGQGDGSFAIEDADVVPNVGVYTKNVTFTPNDQTKYNTLVQAYSILVYKADPNVTWPTSMTVVYRDGLLLSDVSLPQGFAWVNPSTPLSVPGGSYPATYTPADIDNYNVITNDISVAVYNELPSQYLQIASGTGKIGDVVTVAVTVNNPSEMKGLQFDVYYDSNAFELNEQDGYSFPTVNAFSNSMKAAVINQQEGYIRVVALRSDAFAEAQTDAKAVISLNFTIKPLAEVKEYQINLRNYMAAGTGGVFIPLGSQNGIITVMDDTDRINPDVTWPTISAITYGQAFGQAMGDDGLANVAGIFTIEDTEVMPNASDVPYQKVVTFTPENQEQYRSVSQLFPITVNKATPTYTIPTFEPVTYSPTAKLSDITLPTGWTWADGETVPTVNESGYQAIYTPEDTQNYETMIRSILLKVNKAAPNYTIPTLTPVTYSPTAKLSGITLPLGWAWNNGDTIPTVNVTSYPATYIPEDVVNYSTVDATIPLVVNKANPVADWTTVYQATMRSNLKLSHISLKIGYSWVQPNTELNVPGGLYAAVYTPDDTVNYNTAQGMLRVVVNPSAGNIVVTRPGPNVPTPTQNPVPPTVIPPPLMTAVPSPPIMPPPPPPVIIPPSSIGDITSQPWATSFITDVVERGIMSGYVEPDGSRSFRPESTATRAEFATALANYLGLEPSTGASFGDVQQHWASGTIGALEREGIMSGYGAGQFAPEDSITREQMAVILCRAFGLEPIVPTERFSDDQSISDWAVGSVYAVRQAGWMTGDDTGTFRATDTASRAEIATIFSRLATLSEN